MLKKKRIVAIVMTLMMAASLLPSMAFAESLDGGGVDVVVDKTDIKVGETKTIEAEITGTDTPENYHVHWYYHGGKKNYTIEAAGPRSVKYTAKAAYPPGTFEAHVFEGGTCSGAYVGNQKCSEGKKEVAKETAIEVSVTEDNPNPNPAQGAGQTVKWISPELNLAETTGDIATGYVNVIKEPIDGTVDNIFSFLFSAQVGSWSDDNFINNALPHINLVDENGAPIVNDAGDQIKGIEFVSGESLNIKIKIPANTLSAKDKDTKYTLVFGPELNMKGTKLGTTIRYHFTVKKEATSVPETTIVLNETKTTVNVGEEKQLTATVTPAEKTVTWSSDNSQIVTVKQKKGIITGVAPGTATVTAKTEDGKTATCQVTVVKAPVVDPGEGEKPDGDNPGGSQGTGNSSTSGGTVENNIDKTAQTGDDMNPMLFAVIMLAALAAATGTVFYRRQKHQ